MIQEHIFMEQPSSPIQNNCSFSGIRPIMMDLPYPDIQVRAKNPSYAALLSADYCGSVSELSAITQYINNENRLSCVKCPLAKTLLGIAMAEMMHLQKLGELIVLLGGTISFVASLPNGKCQMWTPEFLSIPEQTNRMLRADIEAEQAAIKQYHMHINMIKDDCVNAVLARIIQDEEYHILILKHLLQEL